MLAWELLGAVVGAGLASGREVASFFAQYGVWCIPGVALAAATLYFLADCVPQGLLWCTMQQLLLIATGGAMLSAAGHIAALTLPVQGASAIGAGLSLALSLFLARRTAAGLMWVSRLMLLAMLAMILPGFALPPMQAAAVTHAIPAMGLLRGVTYGGFNAALMVPVLASSPSQGARRRCGTLAGCILAALLLMLGCGVLLRHPALMGESMPFVKLAAQYGPWGYGISAACMYLAILSTTVACLRGVQGVWPVIGMVAVCLLGFEGAVDRLYPLLGGICFLLLVYGKITKMMNSLR